jgi:hypothetical protein
MQLKKLSRSLLDPDRGTNKMFLKRLPGIKHLGLALIAVTLLSPMLGHAQGTIPAREQAMERVGVVSISGWREFIPTDGRFRLLLPGLPEFVDDVRSVYDYRLKTDDTEWRVLYSDLDVPMKDEAELRTTLDRAIGAMARPGTTIRSRTEIRINYQLGDDLILESPKGILFMRTIQAGVRTYIVSALRPPGKSRCSSVPADVQQFFDSFTFWQ